MPLATMRTALITSAASQSLGTKPDAPAARAAAGDSQPAPEISSTLVAGWRSRSVEHSSAPELSPMNRSITATCGR